MLTGPWLLDPSNQRDIERYLVERGLVPAAGLPIAIQRAGDGNMNLALRVTPSSGRSFVLKQGRPWVEKYPQIPAPFERTLVEAAFYTEVLQQPGVAALMPRLLHLERLHGDLALHRLLLELLVTTSRGARPQPRTRPPWPPMRTSGICAV